MISIVDGIEIPDEEIVFVASRSGGPGGQNVNKVSSRVTLLFDIAHSGALKPEERSRIRERLASRINKDGVLRVTSQRTRSQEMNRRDAAERFAELLRRALQSDPPRVATSIPRAAREERLREKRKRTEVKRARTGKDLEE